MKAAIQVLLPARYSRPDVCTLYLLQSVTEVYPLRILHISTALLQNRTSLSRFADAAAPASLWRMQHDPSPHMDGLFPVRHSVPSLRRFYRPSRTAGPDSDSLCN